VENARQRSTETGGVFNEKDLHGSFLAAGFRNRPNERRPIIVRDDRVLRDMRGSAYWEEEARGLASRRWNRQDRHHRTPSIRL
jgi:hypothetical protein